MSARDQWRRTYRAARVAGLDARMRCAVRWQPFGVQALRVADDRPQMRALSAALVPFAMLAAARFLRRAFA